MSNYNQELSPEENLRLLLAEQKTNGATAARLNGNQPLDVLLAKSMFNAQESADGGVQSVNGREGDVTLDKSDVGLSNTDNTSDVNKPVSTAQAAADAAVQAYSIQRENHTGTQSADTIVNGTTNKVFLATEQTKLAGIEAGATANASDAYLLSRSNHTVTQSSTTISDFNSTVRAQVESELIAGTNITLTPSGTGATRQITIAAAGGLANPMISSGDIIVGGSSGTPLRLAADPKAGRGIVIGSSGSPIYNSPQLPATRVVRLFEDFIGPTNLIPWLAAGSAHNNDFTQAPSNGRFGILRREYNSAAFFGRWGAYENLGVKSDYGKQEIACSTFANASLGGLFHRFGFINVNETPAAARPTNGVFIELSAGGAILLICRNSSTETTSDLGVLFTTGVWIDDIRIVKTGTTSVQAFIGGVARGVPITTNIPTSSLGWFFGGSSSGSFNQSYWDWAEIILSP